MCIRNSQVCLLKCSGATAAPSSSRGRQTPSLITGLITLQSEQLCEKISSLGAEQTDQYQPGAAGANLNLRLHDLPRMTYKCNIMPCGFARAEVFPIKRAAAVLKSQWTPVCICQHGWTIRFCRKRCTDLCH